MKMELRNYYILKWSLIFFIAHTAQSQSSQYDRDRQDEQNRNRDQYGQDRNRDQYSNDPYNRNQTNDPYNRNQSNDPYNRNNNYGNDPYNRNVNDPYNRNQSGDNRYNQQGQNGYNQSGDRYNQTHQYGNDPYRNPSDPYNSNRNNDPNFRNNDPNNRNYDRNDPYNKNSNDPYGRNNNDQYGNQRNNDPYNRNQSGGDRYGQQNGSQYGSNAYGSGNNNYGSNSGSPYGGGDSSNTYGSSGGSRFGNDANSNCCEEYCYKKDDQPHVKFGAKTSYQFTYGKISNQHIVPQCKPIQFWSVVREGASLPDRMTIQRLRGLSKIHEEVIKNYEERRSFPDKGRLCAEDFDEFRRWRWNDTVSDHNAGMLTAQGVDDLTFLSRRYQTRLRDLLVPYSENQYFFQYTEGDKSRDSYQAYIQGLFGNDASRVHANVRQDSGAQNQGYGGASSQYGSSGSQYGSSGSQYGSGSGSQYESSSQYGSGSSGSQYGNSGSSQYGNSGYSQYGSGGSGQYGGSMTSSSRCKNYEQRQDEDRSTAIEYNQFKQKQEYKELVRNVFKRLGFRYSLNESVVEDMYDMCRYEKAWYVNRPSPWCAAFTREQLKLLEYGDDLYYYYRSGYGHEMLNKNLGCGLAKDMFERFEKTVNGGQSEQKGIVHFRDVDAILQTIVAMGLNRDQTTLTADNYYQLTRRQWHTADMAPFSGNLAAVLYQCDSTQDKYKVMFFLNENPVDIPECSVGLCTWDTVRNKLQLLSQTCRLDWCERGSANVASSSHFVVLFSTLLLAIYKIVC